MLQLQYLDKCLKYTNITSFYGQLRLLIPDQLTNPSLKTLRKKHNNPSDQGAHLLMIKKQMPSQAGDVITHYENQNSLMKKKEIYYCVWINLFLLRKTINNKCNTISFIYLYDVSCVSYFLPLRLQHLFLSCHSHIPEQHWKAAQF